MPNKPLRTSQAICLGAILLLLAVGLVWKHGRDRAQQVALPLEPAFSLPGGVHNSYETNFASTGYPLSEAGRWISGRAAGVDWSDIQTSGGLAYGTESGNATGDGVYDDSTALLTGAWGADQTAEAEVRSVNPSDQDFEEVELRLRSSLSSHLATGYEVLFRCSKAADAYASIVRWDGPLGKFTYLSQKQGPAYGVANGDTVKATVVGNEITGYINGVEVIRATDSAFAQGSPGIGFWFKKSSSKKFWRSKTGGANTDCGFRRFAAWD